MSAVLSQTHFEVSINIPAPPQVVWSVMADVVHWPEWTPTVSRLKMLTAGPLQEGSRARIHQPGLPPAYWRVTDLTQGQSFTWVSVVPGVRVTARHAIEPIADGALVTLSICYEGFFGKWLARWIGEVNERYLALEAEGLKARCTAEAIRSYSKYHEAH